MVGLHHPHSWENEEEKQRYIKNTLKFAGLDIGDEKLQEMFPDYKPGLHDFPPGLFTYDPEELNKLWKKVAKELSIAMKDVEIIQCPVDFAGMVKGKPCPYCGWTESEIPKGWHKDDK